MNLHTKCNGTCPWPTADKFWTQTSICVRVTDRKKSSEHSQLQQSSDRRRQQKYGEWVFRKLLTLSHNFLKSHIYCSLFKPLQSRNYGLWGFINFWAVLNVSCPFLLFFETSPFRTSALRFPLEHCPGFIGNKLWTKMTISKPFPL